jgi:hypothetical protein
VKKLQLTHCINITGSGLGPLRNSIVLYHLDLTLVGRYGRIDDDDDGMDDARISQTESEGRKQNKSI